MARQKCHSETTMPGESINIMDGQSERVLEMMKQYMRSFDCTMARQKINPTHGYWKHGSTS